MNISMDISMNITDMNTMFSSWIIVRLPKKYNGIQQLWWHDYIMFFLYDFILCPLQFTSHLPLDICCWWWYLLYPVWYSVTSYPRMIYKPPMSYPQWSTSDLLLPLGMISLQSFFIFLVHLFMQSGNSCRYDDTEDVIFGLGLYEFLYLNMLKGWKVLHRKQQAQH